VPLALALSHLWQLGVLAAAALWLLAFRRGVITALVAAALVGVAVAYAGLPLPA
jgi:chromate transporter